MQVIFVYNTFYREYVNIQYNLNLQGYQIFILSKNSINQLKTKMKEAARIQAEESSELLSSFYKKKASDQNKEKSLDYMKYRFKKSDRPSYIIGKIK